MCHFRRQCKIPKKKNKDDSANVVTEEVHDTLLLTIDSPLDDWVLDSGVSFHTTPHREIIENYVAGDFGKVYLVDGTTLDVVVMGDVQILLPNGSVWLLEKVRHILDLRRNLISIGHLMMKGMQYYLLEVLGRLQRELEYWLVEKRLVLYIWPQVQETQL